MRHTCGVHGLEFCNQPLSTDLAAEAVTLQRRVGVFIQVQVNERHIWLVTRHLTPHPRATHVFGRSARVGQPAVQVLADPGWALLCQARHQQR
ncbi:hypothetical protein D3C81_2092720 [compost metagenome]